MFVVTSSAQIVFIIKHQKSASAGGQIP